MKHQLSDFPETVQTAVERDNSYAARTDGELKTVWADKGNLREDCGLVESRIAELSKPEHFGSNYRLEQNPDGTATRIPLGELERVTEKLKTLKDKHRQIDREKLPAVQDKNQRARRIVRQNADYLKLIRPDQVELVQFAAPTLKKGETATAGILRLETARTAITAAQKATAGADRTAAEALAAGMKELNRLDISGKASVRPLFLRNSKAGIVFPHLRLPHATGTHTPPDALAIMVHLFRDRFDEWLKQSVEDHLRERGEGMSGDARKAELTRLQAEKVRIDYELESLVRMVEAEGGHFLRNPRWDVRARLGLAPSMPPPPSAWDR